MDAASLTPATRARPQAGSTDATVVRAAGLTPNIAHCSLESTIDVVPRVLAARTGVPVVGLRDDAEPVDGPVDASDTVAA